MSDWVKCQAAGFKMQNLLFKFKSLLPPLVSQKKMATDTGALWEFAENN